MGITNDLQELMTDTCTWAPVAGHDDFGNATYGTANEYPCRFIKKTRLILGKDGHQIASTRQVWVGASLTSGVPFPMVGPEDKVTLSDGLSPHVAHVEIFQDETFKETGLYSHTVVYFL